MEATMMTTATLARLHASQMKPKGCPKSQVFFSSVGLKWENSWFFNLISSRLSGKITSKWETKKGLSSFQTAPFVYSLGSGLLQFYAAFLPAKAEALGTLALHSSSQPAKHQRNDQQQQ